MAGSKPAPQRYRPPAAPLTRIPGEGFKIKIMQRYATAKSPASRRSGRWVAPVPPAAGGAAHLRLLPNGPPPLPSEWPATAYLRMARHRLLPNGPPLGDRNVVLVRVAEGGRPQL